MQAFREAVEQGESGRFIDLLAEDVTFLSPVAHAPYHGRDMVAAILRAAMRVFEDFRYEREVVDGPHTVLVFRARVGDRDVHGCDMIEVDEQGLIREFCVMVRPLSGAKAVSEAMAAQFETVKRELGLPA